MRHLRLDQRAERETVQAFMKCFFVLLVAFGDFAEGSDLASVATNAQESGEPKRQIVVSIPDRKLALIDGGRIVRSYAVAVGAAVSPSPTGFFQVVSRVADPTYYHSGTVIPPGRFNPLGNRWLGLSKKGYGIHGTNVPSSIGKAASHGCIRMGKQDVEELFSLVRVGDEVEIHGERDARILAIFGGPDATPDSTNKHAAAVVMAAATGEL